MAKFVTAMISYALAIAAIGYLTFVAAAPGSNAWTALVVPGIGAAASIAAAVLATRIHVNRRLGMIAIHAGMVLPLVMAIGSFARLPGSLQKNRDYFASQVLKHPDGTDAAVANLTASKHPTGYQAVGIGSIGVVSLFATVMLVLLRPKPPSTAIVPATSPTIEAPRPASTPVPGFVPG